MESLALMVAVIFLFVLLSGPFSLFVSFLGFRYLGAIFGLGAMLAGGFWLSVAPFPMSLLGAIGLVCGAMSLNKV